MSKNCTIFSIKLFISACIFILLSGCGGSTGFPPVVTAIKAQTLQYGRVATISLGGKDLRTSLVVESNGACANSTFAANSTTDLLILNCTITVVGDLPLNVMDANGTSIYTTTLTVPKPQVALITALGGITLELDHAKAPISVDNFLGYVKRGYYSNTLFHRVIPGFMIQGGGFTTGLVKKPGLVNPIFLESKNGLSNLRGTLAMARTNVANSATSEFYINLVDNLFLNYRNEGNPGYVVFGNVVQGLDVVDSISAKPTGIFNGYADVPLEDVTISMALQVK
jgi:cyclophilin family peptidyl-prolyl cis-trans isomerase